MLRGFLIAGLFTFLATSAGQVKQNPKDGQPYVWVPAGTFTMGCSQGDTECRGEQAPHAVRISHGFWIGQTEVTVGAYKQFVTATKASMPPDSRWNPGWQDDHRPIVNLTWDDAAAFCSAAGGRLPSEEEWNMRLAPETKQRGTARWMRLRGTRTTANVKALSRSGRSGQMRGGFMTCREMPGNGQLAYIL